LIRGSLSTYEKEKEKSPYHGGPGRAQQCDVI